MDIQICENPEMLARQAAYEFVRLANEAIGKTGRFTVALSGGSTPRLLYETLAADAFRPQVLWSNVEFFWGDERGVPPDHADSNYRMAFDTLLSRVPVDEASVHRIRGELDDPEQAAAEYEQTIREVFELPDGTLPRFDLILLGLGEDGHTASLFPGAPALEENRRIVVGYRLEGLNTHRITLTPPAINGAFRILFLVSGAHKASILKHVLQGAYQPHIYPAQLIQPQAGRLTWLIDRPASQFLDLPSPEEPSS